MGVEGLFLDERRLALEKARGIWPDRVITDYLDRWVREKPDATAIIAHRDEDATTTRLSWRELNERVGAIAAGLAARGVAKGEVVSFQLPNWWEFVAMHLACVRIGAISNPLMPIFRRRELSFMVRHAEAKILVVPAYFRNFDHGGLARELKREIDSLEHVLLVGGEDEDSFEATLLAGAKEHALGPGSGMDANDVVQLLYTSGTTGEPKGALHTSNTLIGTTITFAERMQFGERDVIFMPSPLAHQAGFTYGLVAAVVLGLPMLLVDAWKPACAVELMEKHAATFTFAATPFLSDLANFPDVEKRALQSFRLFVTSGAPIPPVLVEQAQKRLRATVVVAGWGMTECGIASATPLSGHKVLDSDGAALPGEELRVIDDQGREAPRGQAGALQFRGASLFVGYLKRPQLYEVDSEGWFETGDIARMDEEGYIRICGRRKDIIIRGGENIPVVQVESALYKMPEIAEAAIVAMPDPRLSERACAFVTLRDGQGLAIDDVRAFLAAEGLAKQFWPERLEILDRMPRTPTGKIQKFVLRDMAKILTERIAKTIG
ncbi:MAG: AMP-binding protein [Betaproteobacteria bacterium]|nr:AMP-binding protein [Betaproteobacteria bacterium]